eukprot:526906-Prymnesium_polylepis.1
MVVAKLELELVAQPVGESGPPALAHGGRAPAAALIARRGGRGVARAAVTRGRQRPHIGGRRRLR